MNVPPHTEASSPSPQLPSQSTQKPRNISTTEQRPSFSRQQRPPHQSLFDRDREQSAGGWSTSSVGTGGSGPSSSANRTMSRRLARGLPSGLAGVSNLGKKRDKHSLALLSIRELLKGRSCYDCLPVSFRLVVLDTKLVVKPALEVMWQAGIVSAPLWQSTSDPVPSSDMASAVDAEEALSPSALSAKLAATDLAEANTNPSSSRSPISNISGMHNNNIHSNIEASYSPSPSALLSETGSTKLPQQSSAPPPGKAGFAGMLTVNDIIHLIQYYYQHSSYDNAAQDVEKFRLEMLREIEQTLHVPQPPLISIEPLRPLFDACELLIKTHARRLPLLDHDEQTGMETVVSVLTQYRVLKFIAMNCRETAGLNRTLRSLGIGTYVKGTRGVGRTSVAMAATTSARGSVSSSSRRSSTAATSHLLSPHNPTLSGLPSAAEIPTPTAGVTAETLPPLEEAPMQANSPPFSPNPQFFQSRLGASSAAAASSHNPYEPLATATLDTTVFDVVHVFSEKGISAVPILDEEGYVVDMYETVDVIDLVRSGAYQSLDLTIRQALSKRSKDFPGVMTCGPDDSLATIFVLLRTKRVHRLLILEPEVEKDVDPFDKAEGFNSADPTSQKQNDPLAGLGEIKGRKRGKLVGILCLSDILRYIIGGKANAPVSRLLGGGVVASASTTASAMGDREEGSSVIVEGDDKASNIATSLDEKPPDEIPESGPRPVEMPPTIQEQPLDEIRAAPASEGLAGETTLEAEPAIQTIKNVEGEDKDAKEHPT